ncbi:MAG: conserved phage C-terminal domain-containing protein [Lachnospiraceae bacterium]|nr:conserved phage C-terminal domain-containing protein [Lachnospiraceae bacterium]MBR4414800.1 conserved phage C-terminal domain-containing protein [Aeriscardovia sp.]
MAEKRMFSKTIVDSDAFLDMPLSAQALYFHLSMRADDDGFLNNAKKIMRTINANQNDYDLLIAKAFIIQFDDGICVIKHWRINNYLRSDRYKPTIYQEQKNMLEIKDNGRYSLINQDGIPDGYQCETQNSIDKNSIDKNSIDILPDKKEPEICKEIIEYLNLKANTKFRTNSSATKRHLNARLAEGFTIDDFKKVIDVKCAQWLNDPNMKKYLRPETLFKASHFESYLNEYVEPTKTKYADAIERMNKHMEERTKEIGDVDLGDFY